MQVHLIRHGNTLANEQKLYCGVTDLPLSNTGIAELVHLKSLSMYPKSADIYYTSGLLRTEQTLDLLYGSVCRVALPQFAEFNFGSFEMKSYEMLKCRNDYQAWITDETGHVSCPGGDNKHDFTRRITETYEHMMEKAQDGDDLLMVCHGGVITCIMEHLFPNTRNFYEWQPKPGYGYTLDYTVDGLVFRRI